MQGLRPLQAHQDENSGIMARNTLPGKSFGGEEGRSGAMGPMKTPKAAGMPSARKALGNITNHGLHASNILPGKTPAAGSVARKPLGNVFTNSNAPSEPAAPVQATTQAISSEDRIAKLAQDGVETTFGKGWEDLERDREDRMDEEISQRLSAMASLGRRGLPTYYPHWAASVRGAGAAPATLEKEEISITLPSPVKMPRSSSFTISEDDFSDLSFLPSIGDDGSDDLPSLP